MSTDSNDSLNHYFPFRIPPDKEFEHGLPPGSLYLVATPIGNLRDISLRALTVLSLVDIVAAEDTRRAGILLDAYGIQKKRISCFAHNEEKQSKYILSLLEEGKTVAMVSDAGMPGISDPGARLVRQAVDAGVKLCVVPGASAGITALAGSGLATDTYAFSGFFPRTTKGKSEWLALYSRFPGTLLFYESPKRLLSTLRSIQLAWGERPCCIARELTKHFEQYVRGSFSEVIAELEEVPQLKGEIVVLIEGWRPPSEPNIPGEDMEEDMKQFGSLLLDSGMGKKEASRELARKTGLSAKYCYDFLIKMI